MAPLTSCTSFCTPLAAPAWPLLTTSLSSSTVHLTSNSVHFTSNSVHFISNSVHFISKSVNFTSNSVHFTSSTVHFPSSTVHFPSRTVQLGGISLPTVAYEISEILPIILPGLLDFQADFQGFPVDFRRFHSLLKIIMSSSMFHKPKLTGFT